MAGVLGQMAALLVPPRCCTCEGRCSPGAAVCPDCFDGLRRLPATAGPGWWSAASYEGVARQAVIALKFGRLTRLASVMAELMASRAPAALLGGALVPVPASPGRRRVRGFDPAFILARELAGLAARPLVTPLVRSEGPRQAQRHRSERIASPPAVGCPDAAPRHAVLVDDVRTTGATLAACALALRSGGAEHVSAVTFAWTRPFVHTLGAGPPEA